MNEMAEEIAAQAGAAGQRVRHERQGTRGAIDGRG